MGKMIILEYVIIGFTWCLKKIQVMIYAICKLRM